MRFAILLFLAFAGCASSSQPPHPLMGAWQGQKMLVLGLSEYSFGDEHGQWTADSGTFRFKVRDSAGPAEKCTFSMTGPSLVLSGCRLAGRYRRSG